MMATFVVLGMLVIGGASTVSGAVFGSFLATFAFEGLRSVEVALNRAQIFAEPVVGLTEVALALTMIGILILRPGGLFATAEIGAARLFRGRSAGGRQSAPVPAKEPQKGAEPRVSART